MERHVEEDVDGWPTRPIDGGYDGLRQLAAAEFSGAVRARGACMFMLNGRIVGVFDGSVEDFDGASGTAHKAPHPSLPLLYTMQERGGETRGKYYTNETPISEVHETLSSGGFTGYVELSENVLSGDYYMVYHAGKAMSLAFIGNNGRLVTGDEAFERADDEVGIYAVNEVEVDVRDVPGLGDDGDATGETAAPDEDDASDAATGDDATDESAEPDSGTRAPDATEETASEESDPSVDATEAGGSPPNGTDTAGTGAAGTDASDAQSSAEAAATDAGRTGAPETGRDAEPAAEAGTEPAAEANAESPTEPDVEPATADDRASGRQTADDASTPTTPAESEVDATDAPTNDARATEATPTDAGAPRAEPDARSGADDTAAESRSSTASERGRAGGSEVETGRRGRSTADAEATGGRDAGQSRSPTDNAGSNARSAARTTAGASAESDETTVIPSLDPDRTADVTPSDERTSTDGRSATGDASASAAAVQQSADAMGDTFEEEVLEREDRIDSLQQRVSNLQTERERVAAERDTLAERVSELEAENEELYAEIEELERQLAEQEALAADHAAAAQSTSDAAGGASGPAQLRPRSALEGTDLFVRYDSKGAATLEDAHAGTAEPDAVNENLRLDLHTRFDADEATVDGEPFRAFLEETMAFRFVEWLVRRLPYEIRDTGQEAGMRDCYDAIPEIDRVEFFGEVELTYQEDGETVQAEEQFDVVVRDRMGEALFVADLNDSRDPANADMLVDLQNGATRVKETKGALAAAFAVTRSFFDPTALETASEATSDSLLSRDSRRSYVKVSRKRGYHLCLVEARDDDLHLNVPEL